MINEELLKKYEELQKSKKVLSGRVILVQRHEVLDTDILMLDLEGVEAIITRDNIDIRPVTTSLVNFVGKRVQFTITEIDREAGVLICSRKTVVEAKRDAMIKRLETGESVQAKIVKVLKFGAYVEIDGVTALLRNQDFSEDYTTVGDIKKVNDTLEVKLKKVSANSMIFVEATEKYKTKTIMSLDLFEKDQVILGLIRNIKPWGAYVCIAPNLDALCPVPEQFTIEEGMKVTFRIMQVKHEEGRVRGKIIKVITEEE